MSRLFSLKTLFCVVLVAFFFNQPQATIIHVPADSSTIQGGINGAVNGDTVLVATGAYYEHVIDNGVDDITLLGDKAKVIGTEIKRGIHLTEVSGWSIEGFEVTGCYDGGITVTNCSNITISDNYSHHNNRGLGAHGISVVLSDSINVKGNTCSHNYSDGSCVGIWVWSSTNSVVANNTIHANKTAGIIVSMTGSGIVMKNNILTSNGSKGIIFQHENGAFPDPYSVTYNNCWGHSVVNFDRCFEGVGDTSWGLNYNYTPCDSFYNIIRDPMFADTISYALLCSSACIDAGDPSSPVPDTGGRRIDIGAFEYRYVMGDANGDGIIDLGDVVFLIGYLCKGGPAPCPTKAGDCNCDGIVDLGDVVYLINYLYRNGPPPCDLNDDSIPDC